MTVRVLLFGPYAAAVGMGEVSITTPDNATSEQVFDALGNSFGVLRPLLQSARLAVNQSFAPPGTVIHPDDEVAVIGMVSGG